jgi:PhnB protein
MAQVKAIPDGYHSLTPYLNVKGCEQAIAFYKKAFGAEERMRMPGPNGTIMHCELKIGDSILMLSDAAQVPPTQSALHFYVNDVDTVFRSAIAAGAQVRTAVEDMPWGDRYGMVVDPFGNAWGIATHKEDVSPAEMEKRMKAAQSSQKK